MAKCVGALEGITALNTSLSHAARKVSIGILALIILCGGVGIWSSWQLSNALREQASAADLLRNHMTADMMHDAVRSDVLAVLLAQEPGSGIDREKAASDLKEHANTLKKAIETDIAYGESSEIAAATKLLGPSTETYVAAAEAIVTSNAGRAMNLAPFMAQFRKLETGMATATDAIESHSDQTA